MTGLDTMLEQNRAFAVRQVADGTLMPSLPVQLPHVKAVVIGCADMRVDPEAILGFAPGEAVVMRNIGGRITPGSLEQLGLLGRIGEVAKAVPGGGGEFHLIVIHHTDCGITRLLNDPTMLAGYFQVREDQLAAKCVEDPRAAVTADVKALRAVPGLPPGWLLSGIVYDVATAVVELVVPPAPIASPE